MQTATYRVQGESRSDPAPSFYFSRRLTKRICTDGSCYPGEEKEGRLYLFWAVDRLAVGTTNAERARGGGILKSFEKRREWSRKNRI